jgi:hypothetical protein
VPHAFSLLKQEQQEQQYNSNNNEYNNNNNSTCGIIVIRERRSCRPMSAIFMPSISMHPPAASRMRNSDSAIDDFPAPVRPTIPIYNQDEYNSFFKL